MFVLKVPADTEQMILNMFINNDVNSSKFEILQSFFVHVFRHVGSFSAERSRHHCSICSVSVDFATLQRHKCVEVIH